MGPEKNCIEVDGVTGRRYQGRDGVYDMHPSDARFISNIGGFIPGLNGVRRKSVGYVCESCGFGAYFTTCGRCGGSAVRES